ncbi:MAG TPA: ABC transporter ATP-binding protein [Solirubrobacteraceae bacterium]|jgi:putative ABC transport system ATP-binding protein|nr:ABC transporter ATP-binding protein [Solirubrobacteraceae bacterium]
MLESKHVGPMTTLEHPEPPPVLELEGAHKRYASPGEMIYAVRDVNMRVYAREFVALFGPSGSGKTTLLLLAAGLLRADGGSVRFDGRDLSTLSKRKALAYRRTELGFVFQSFNLAAGLTAEENTAIPLLLRGVDHREARRRARAALDEVGLTRRSAHTPERLSGGEQQRVAIARALVGEPKLILADEATGNLDSETGATVLELLGALARERGAATILVTHDAGAVRYADRVLSIRDGRLSEVAAPAQTQVRR